MVDRLKQYLTSQEVSKISHRLNLVFPSLLKNLADFVGDDFVGIMLNILKCNCSVVGGIFLLNGCEDAGCYSFDASSI